MGARRVVFHRRNAGPAQTFFVAAAFSRPKCSRAVARDWRRRQREPFNTVEDRGEQVPRHRHLGQLKEHVLRVPRYLRSDLDELFPQRRQRPVPNWLNRNSGWQQTHSKWPL